MYRKLSDLVFRETAGLARTDEPATFGLPLPRGLVRRPEEISLRTASGEGLPLQAAPAAHWPDGSIRWLHCNLQASVPAHGGISYALGHEDPPAKAGAPATGGIKVTEGDGFLDVDTGARIFRVATRGVFHPLEDRTASGGDGNPRLGSDLVLSAAKTESKARIDSVEAEVRGPVRTVIRTEGGFGEGRDGLRFTARHHFHSGKAACRLDLTVHNPRAGAHPNNRWDLGDRRSILFDDLSLRFGMEDAAARRLEWSLHPGEATVAEPEGDWELFQASSGGENWRSTNHVNAQGKVPIPFNGCRLRKAGGERIWAERAAPTCALGEGADGLSVTVKDFWQNFPKAVSRKGGRFSVHLFPGQFGEAFELQPGEKKTHTLWFHGGAAADGQEPLRWTHSPLVPVLPSGWYVEAGVFPYLTSPSPEDGRAYSAVVEAACRGRSSFAAKREVIDEYGWRNFGEVYADHESAFNAPGKPYVSHYNNQYDLLYGTLQQFCRSGDADWLGFAGELASHVRDVDIYHTTEDRHDFNGGLFWHTNHYLDAETVTHRCFSNRHVEKTGNAGYGGGPSPAHLYATGLLNHWYLTGEADSLAGAREIIGFAEALLRGPASLKAKVKTRAKAFIKEAIRIARRRKTRGELAWPCRAAANVLNALTDGYIMTRDPAWLDLADRHIRKCIHPDDNPGAMELDDAEFNWSYAMFLQAVGRFLDETEGLPGADLEKARKHGRDSLLAYAAWMARSEKPYLSKPEKLEFPTETWAATELRKTNVFLLASKYADGPAKAEYRRLAGFYYDQGFEYLLGFGEKAHYARPVAILMTNGLMYEHFKRLS